MAGAAHVQDVRTENCSCIASTSAVHGGRMSRAQDTGNAPGIYSISSIRGGHAPERRYTGCEGRALELFLTVPAFPPSLQVMYGSL